MMSRLTRGWHPALLPVVMLAILASACITITAPGGGSAQDQKTQPTAQAAKPDATAPAGAVAAPKTDQGGSAQPTGAVTGGQAATDWMDRAMHGTVKIWTVRDADKSGDLTPFALCSGVLVDPSGVILTNWHCVGLTSDEKTDISKQGLRPGEMYNSQGIIVVGLTEDPKQAPQPQFLAKVRQGSPDLDVAVAKIFATVGGGRLPASLPLTTVPLGDSEAMKLGDPIYIFGYPGVGGELITETAGKISGFFKEAEARPDIQVDAFKTDAVINHGNSGGLATNEKGEDIGIPTFGVTPESGPGLGGVRLVNLAKPYIAKAMNDAFDPLSPRLPAGSQGPAPAPTPAPAPPQGNGKFANLVFGTDAQGEKLVGQGSQFPTGTKKIVAQFNFTGISAGTPWGYVLTIDGDAAIDKHNANTWKDQGSGQYLLSFGNGDQPLPNGKYELSLFIGAAVAVKGTFAIGGGPTPPQPPAKGTALKGKVVDADTGRGIPGAYFIVLKPGVTVKQFVDGNAAEDMMAAAAQTDAQGNFLTDPPLPGGKTYGVAVVAKGYKFLGVDNALTLPANVPAQMALDQPVKLQKN